MKNFTLIVAALLATACNAQTITPEQANNNAGKNVTVCGKVSDTYVSTKGQAPTFLHFGGTYPNYVFTAVIYKDDVTKFTYPLTGLANKNICVTGLIKLYKGKPEMVINSPAQIVIK